MHRMYAEARAMEQAAGAENEKFRSYLKDKYKPQVHVLE